METFTITITLSPNVISVILKCQILDITSLQALKLRYLETLTDRPTGLIVKLKRGMQRLLLSLKSNSKPS